MWEITENKEEMKLTLVIFQKLKGQQDPERLLDLLKTRRHTDVLERRSVCNGSPYSFPCRVVPRNRA